MAVVTYIQNHSGELWAIFSSIVTVATLIVKLTPTQKDDTVLAKIVGFIDKFVALNK